MVKELESLRILDAISRNQLTDTSVFIDKMGMRVGLRIENRGRGRPRRSVK